MSTNIQLLNVIMVYVSSENFTFSLQKNYNLKKKKNISNTHHQGRVQIFLFLPRRQIELIN